MELGNILIGAGAAMDSRALIVSIAIVAHPAFTS
jgi:hypothetical protein